MMAKKIKNVKRNSHTYQTMKLKMMMKKNRGRWRKLIQLSPLALEEQMKRREEQIRWQQKSGGNDVGGGDGEGEGDQRCRERKGQQ